MNYYLGIDWGEKKCGVALADSETRLAFAWKVFSSKDFEKDFKKNTEKFSFLQVVVGINEKYDFSFNNKKKILIFKKRLESLGLKVVFQEEFFSTRIAQKNLQESQKSGKSNDAEAARIILQSWLDKNIEKC